MKKEKVKIKLTSKNILKDTIVYTDKIKMANFNKYNLGYTAI